jgi:hypothetical protein
MPGTDTSEIGATPHDSLLQRLNQRLTALRSERSTWVTHWQELSDNIFPRRFRYLQTDRNKGTKRNDKIINNKPTIAVRILAAGMMAGLTSPARPWFRLTLSNPLLADDDDVKEWLAHAEKVLFETFAKSNLYNCLHEVYGIEATFATAVLYIEEDEEDDVRGYVFPVGQFMLAASASQRVDTMYREFSMTAAQMVENFGIKNVSTTVQLAYRENRKDQWFEVAHAIEPNRGRDTGKLDGKNKPWRSVWWEKSASSLENKFLRQSGFEEFPVMVGRWFVTGEDVYGSGSPGMDGLGDCKALQILERRKAQAMDKIINPPMNAPASMKSTRLTLLPGDTNYVPDGQQGVVKPAIDVHPESVREARESIKEHESRISDTFFASLFLMMLNNNDGVQPKTAREINERHEEKMLQLGPTIERNEDELLDPMINRVANIQMRRGRIRPPPPQLHGQRVKVEYISIMAQAQKLLGTASTERLTSFVGSLSAVNKDVLDILNFDKIVIEYAKMLGVPPDMINPQKVIAQIRAQRQQAQAQQAAMQQATQGAQAAKAASEAELDKGSLLDRMMAGTGMAPPGSGSRA